MSDAGPHLPRGKDVFDAVGAYIGTVVWVRARRRTRGPVPATRATQDGSTFSGETIGPMPTVVLGNTGPRSQSQATAYATSLAETQAGEMGMRQPAELVVLRLPTSLNWSTLRPRVRRISFGLVQAVSHERIVLSVAEADLE